MSETKDISVGLYDSNTGKSLKAAKVVDVTAEQDRATEALLVYVYAKRGLIVQLHSDGVCIHYFMKEAGGRRMMREDSERFGFAPGRLLALADANAP